MAVDDQKSPRRASLALAELDSFLFDAGSNFSPEVFVAEGKGSTDETQLQNQRIQYPNPKAEDSPNQFDSQDEFANRLAMRGRLVYGANPNIAQPLVTRNLMNCTPERPSVDIDLAPTDNASCSDSIRSPPLLQRRVKAQADDDISISCSTIVSKDVSSYSKEGLISNLDDVDQIVQHLTRPSPAASNRSGDGVTCNTADVVFVQIARDAMSRDGCTSVDSFKAEAISLASKSSKQYKRSIHSHQKRGNSLEREISKYILQTAAGGADTAHFLVLSDESTEITFSPDDILDDLQDLLETQSQYEAAMATRSSQSQLDARGIMLEAIGSSIKSGESNETIHTTNESNRKKQVCNAVIPLQKKGGIFLDDLVLVAAIATDYGTNPMDTPSPDDCFDPNIVKSVWPKHSVEHDSTKSEHLDREGDFVVSLPSSAAKERLQSEWINFVAAKSSDDNTEECEYHYSIDDDFSAPPTLPASFFHIEKRTKATGDDVWPTVLEEHSNTLVSKVEPEGGYINYDSDLLLEESDIDSSIAPSHVSEAYSIIMSLAEHAAIAYNLKPAQSNDDEPLDTNLLQGTSTQEAEDVNSGSLEPERHDDNHAFSDHAFETSKAGFGGIYAFDMDDDEGWTTFGESVAEASRFSPNRSTTESLAKSDTSSIVYTHPNDRIKKEVAQPESPISVVASGSIYTKI